MTAEKTNKSETSNSQSNLSQSPAGSLWTLSVKVAGKILNWIWRTSLTVVGYYWERRQAFWRHFTEYARDLRPERFVTREIRISTEEQYLNAEYDDRTWKVRLPKMCIVCGEPQKGKPLTGEYQVENLTGPFWSVIFGTFFGFILWMFVWRWFFPIGVIVGFLVGYRRHSMVNVDVRYWKCDKHRKNNRYPRLRTFADFLILGVGSKNVRQEFRHQRKGNRGDYGSYEHHENQYESHEYGSPEQAPPAVPDIEPIPLADEAHETVEPEEKDWLDSNKTDESEIPPL